MFAQKKRLLTVALITLVFLGGVIAGSTSAVAADKIVWKSFHTPDQNARINPLSTWLAHVACPYQRHQVPWI